MIIIRNKIDYNVIRVREEKPQFVIDDLTMIRLSNRHKHSKYCCCNNSQENHDNLFWIPCPLTTFTVGRIQLWWDRAKFHGQKFFVTINYTGICCVNIFFPSISWEHGCTALKTTVANCIIGTDDVRFIHYNYIRFFFFFLIMLLIANNNNNNTRLCKKSRKIYNNSIFPPFYTATTRFLIIYEEKICLFFSFN